MGTPGYWGEGTPSVGVTPSPYNFPHHSDQNFADESIIDTPFDNVDDKFHRHSPPYAVTKYVVDSNGGAPYCTLHDAMVDALNDCKGSSRPPTILLRPGTYSLTEAFRSRRPVNVVGTSFNAFESPVVKGCANSGGNKNWNGVRFKGADSEYIINNRRSCEQGTDTFEKCQFTDNFKITTMNDRGVFTNCDFNYNGLDRDRVLETRQGSGIFEVLKSRIEICRTGSSCAHSFYHHGSNTCVRRSVVMCNKITLDVTGKDTFCLFRMRGMQPLDFLTNHVEVTQSQAKTYLFGSPTIQKNIELSVKGSQFIGSEHCNSTSVSANIFPRLQSGHPLIFHANLIQAMRSMWYGEKCNGRPERPVDEKCSYNGDAPCCGKKKKHCRCRPPPCHPHSSKEEDCSDPNSDTDKHFFQWTSNHIVTNKAVNFHMKGMEYYGKIHLHLHGNFMHSPVGVTKEMFKFTQHNINNKNGYLELFVYHNALNNEDTQIPSWLYTTTYDSLINWNSTVNGSNANYVGGSMIIGLDTGLYEGTNPAEFQLPFISQPLTPLPP